MQKNKPDTIRIQTNDIYAYLFALNRKQCLSDQEQQQIRAIERLMRTISHARTSRRTR